MFGTQVVRTETAGRAWFGWTDESSRRASEKLPLQQTPTGLLLTGDLNFYNRQSLGEALGISGALLGGLSDSELLLACWQAWGEAALSRLRGDYAFALWDERRRELLLARGPLSAASLFWRELPEGVAFASSRDLLLRLPEIDRKPDLDTAAQFVAGLPFANDRTMFAGIKRLGHGQLARIARGRADVQRFWEPTRRERPMGGRDDAA